MPKLEVFFDYACPFCLKGHQNLIELLPDYPQIEVIWRPCEAHPRPERYGPHSDLCIQGMFFAAENGADLLAYHAKIYSLTFTQRVNIENVDVLAENVSDLLDADKFKEALQSKKYQKIQEESNDYAYKKSGVWAIPTYRMNGKKLDSIENIGVPKAYLKEFFDKN